MKQFGWRKFKFYYWSHSSAETLNISAYFIDRISSRITQAIQLMKFWKICSSFIDQFDSWKIQIAFRQANKAMPIWNILSSFFDRIILMNVKTFICKLFKHWNIGKFLVISLSDLFGKMFELFYASCSSDLTLKPFKVWLWKPVNSWSESVDEKF